jgi:hypothetical protein
VGVEAGAVLGAGCCEEGAEAVSPPTGAVPGAGWAVGALAGVVLAGVVLDGLVCEVDCAPSVAASVNANPASVTVIERLKSALMTSPPAQEPPSRAAPLRSVA